MNPYAMLMVFGFFGAVLAVEFTFSVPTPAALVNLPATVAQSSAAFFQYASDFASTHGIGSSTPLTITETYTENGVAQTPPVQMVRADGFVLDGVRYLGPHWLQVVTAWTVAKVTGGIHVGHTVRFPRLWVIVDPQCTGMATMLYCALLALCFMPVIKSWRWRVTLVLMAIFGGFAANIIRIVNLTA